MIETTTTEHVFRRFNRVIHLRMVIGGSQSAIYRLHGLGSGEAPVPVFRRPSADEVRDELRLLARHFAGEGFTEIIED